MATSRLAIYNGALTLCGVRKVASLSVTEESRYLLDDVWTDGGVDYCLAEGQWRFAMRTQRLDYSVSITPSFGLRRAFEKSSDWLLTSAVCQDEYYRVPLLNYTDEARILYADLDQIYVKFVSNDASYGGDFSLWPAAFTEYVKAYFASKVIMKLTDSKERREELIGTDGKGGILRTALDDARNRDSINEPTKFPAPGSWTRSRLGRGNRTNWDGGNPNSLIG